MGQSIFRRISIFILTLLLMVLAVPPLLAQGGIVLPENAPLWMVLLAAIFPIGAGWLANLAMDGLRVLIPKLDAGSSVVKQIVAVLVALGVGFLATKFGATLDPDLHNWQATSLVELFTILAQQGIFKAKSDKLAAAQGEPTLTQRRMGVTVLNARKS